MLANLENKISNLSSWLIGLVLILAPVWAFISVWASSSLGHYTAIRLIVECLLVLVVLGTAALLIIDKKLARNLFRQKWLWPLAAFVVLEIIWGIVAHYTDSVSLKALGYGWVVDLRYLLFFVAVYVIASKNHFLKNHWPKLIFIPAAVVAIFAALQFAVLPLNFLSHFGYNSHTIFPYETINHNKNFVRAMSFTRGANPLGSYLLIIITLALAWLAKVKNKLWLAFLTLVSLAALVFSFSRSAWLGLVISLFLLVVIIMRAKTRKIMLAGGGVIIIILVIIFAVFHNGSQFQNYVFHTQSNSKIKTTSDEGHLTSFRNGFSDFASTPLGQGSGSAGPASVYNRDQPARISENYYLMIGEENGWLGLALLLAFFSLVAAELYRGKTKMSLTLFAAFIGLAVTNFLLPAWTDITLAYIFWGLAGIALSDVQSNYGRKTNRQNLNPAHKKAT